MIFLIFMNDVFEQYTFFIKIFIIILVNPAFVAYKYSRSMTIPPRQLPLDNYSHEISPRTILPGLLTPPTPPHPTPHSHTHTHTQMPLNNCPLDNYHPDNCPPGQLSLGFLPLRQLHVNNSPLNNLPPDNCPPWNYPQDNYPQYLYPQTIARE